MKREIIGDITQSDVLITEPVLVMWGMLLYSIGFLTAYLWFLW